MFVFAREPIFDQEQQLFAYQLVFRDGVEGKLPVDSKSLESDDEKAAQIKVGLSELLEGYVSVISMSRNAIFKGLYEELRPEDTILEFESIDAEDKALCQKLLALSKSGFRISVHHDKHLSKKSLALAHYLKIDINKISVQALKKLKDDIAPCDVQTIATRVQSPEQYDKCIEAGFDFFQGYFFLARKHDNHDELPASKLSLLQLLAQTSDSDIDMDKIRVTFEHDATLSYLLMRFINNPMINKSHKITSIKHALSYLGELMLRKFVAIVSIAELNQDNVQELLQVSLVRAKYCELLDIHLGNTKDAMSAFITGLFSLIDVILDRDMVSLLNQISLSPEINQALTQREGDFYVFLASIRSLEASSWLPFKQQAKILGVAEEKLHQIYLQAVRWNNAMMHEQSEMFPVAKTKR